MFFAHTDLINLSSCCEEFTDHFFCAAGLMCHLWWAGSDPERVINLWRWPTVWRPELDAQAWRECAVLGLLGCLRSSEAYGGDICHSGCFLFAVFITLPELRVCVLTSWTLTKTKLFTCHSLSIYLSIYLSIFDMVLWQCYLVFCSRTMLGFLWIIS